MHEQTADLWPHVSFAPLSRVGPRFPARAGTEGAFRLGCEHALGALRANEASLCALLEAALLDPAVDWDSEAAAKAGSKASSGAGWGAVQQQQEAWKQASSAPVHFHQCIQQLPQSPSLPPSCAGLWPGGGAAAVYTAPDGQR